MLTLETTTQRDQKIRINKKIVGVGYIFCHILPHVRHNIRFGNVKNLSYIVYNNERLTIKDTSEAEVKGSRLNGA
jgi:hypothetical protein